MRANYVGNTALQERLHRPEPEVRAIVEAVVVSNADTRETQGDWEAVDSQTGLRFPEVGGTQLDRDTSNVHATHDTASADQENVITDLDNQSPWYFLELEWTDVDPTFEIHKFTATIDPDVDGTGREAQKLRCQIFAVSEFTDDYIELMATSARSEVDVTGNSQADFTFDFDTNVVPPSAGPLVGGGGEGADSDETRTYVLVWGVKSDGSPAGNMAWVGDNDDSAGTVVQDGGGSDAATVTAYKMSRIDDAQRVNVGGRFTQDLPVGGIPDFDLSGVTYTEETASFTGSSNQIDLGASPDSDTDLVVVAQGEEPGDSTLTWEISDDSGATWVEVADGDVVGEDNTPDGNDLSGVSRQQTYQIRVTLSPSSDGHTSPFARRIGVEELTTTDLDGVASVEDAGNWSFDPVTLVGEIPEATISLLKEGVRDYRSQGEKLFADNHIGDMDFRIWIGHPDLPRKNWLHVDTFEVDDYNSEGGAIEVIGLSPLKQLKTGIPPYDESANERTPVTYTNQTLKAAWDDLLDSQVALPGRFRGPGVEDTTSQSVTKTIRDSDGKTELDAIAHLAGGTVVTSQGTVKYQEAFTEDKGGVRQTFPQEEIRVQSVRPGYRNRVEEYFVSYAYDDDRDEFDGAVRSFYAPSIAKLGGKGLDMEEDLDEAAARWLPTPNDTTSNDPAQNLAAHVARRTTSPNGLGPGLKQVRFESTIPHPELEPGDPVVVETDQLVIKDPATDTAFRGLLWLTGVVQTQHDIWGRELTVWVQQIEDAIPSEEDSDRDTGTAGPAKITFSEDRAAGNATVTVNITGPGSYDVTIYRMDTDGTETQVASQTGITDGGANDPFSHTESLRESEALPMRAEVSSSTGKLVQVDTATLDADEIADTSLSVHIRDDGTPVARGRMDLDGTGGVIHLTQSTGSSPTATDPDGTENTVNLAAGERAWEHVFSATVAKGDDLSVKARPEAADGTLSPTDRIVEVGDSRPGNQTTFDGTPSAQLRINTRATDYVDYDLLPESGSDVSNPDLRYRGRVQQEGGVTAWSSWSSIADADDGTWITDAVTGVDRAGKHPRMLEVQVQDEAPSSNPTTTAYHPVPPKNDALDDSDGGKIDPGQNLGGGYTPPSGSGPVPLDVSVDQTYEGPQNLLGPDAGPEQSFGNFYLYLDQISLSTLGLEVGDVVSARMEVKSETGADNVRVQLTFRDSDGSDIQFSNGNQISSSTYGVSTVEDVTIPANTATISVAADNVDNTETAYARRAMLDRGPIAHSFVEPPVRTERETADSLWYGGRSQTVEDLKPLEENATQDPAQLERVSVVGEVTNNCSNGGIELTIEWETHNYDTSKFEILLELWADFDGDGVYGFKQGKTPTNRGSALESDLDAESWALGNYTEDGACTSRNYKVIALIRRTANNAIVDQMESNVGQANFYSCLDSACASGE